jgi:putative solute:sodium symporter small subunit
MEANSPDPHSAPYQRACLKIAVSLLLIWFSVSFGCGIIFREWLDTNAPQVGSAPFGFWMAQQGSIIVFVILLVTYAVLMNRLDSKHGYSEDEDSAK